VSPGADDRVTARERPLCAGGGRLARPVNGHHEAGRPPVWLHGVPDIALAPGILTRVQDGPVQGRPRAGIHTCWSQGKDVITLLSLICYIEK